MLLTRTIMTLGVSDMTSRTRLWVLVVSTPVIAFALHRRISRSSDRSSDETYQHLRVFQDVVSLVVDNYVEEVDVKQAMRGAMRGLADGLDPDSAYLTPDLAKNYEANAPMGAADPGMDITRQYYLRVVSVRPNSPAAKAGLRTGDYIRAIDGKPTREMAAYEGARLLHGSGRQPRQAAGHPRQRGRSARGHASPARRAGQQLT